MNENDNYIFGVVSRHTPVISYNAKQIMEDLNLHIFPWSNGHKYELKLAGSIAKGTCITGTTDIDLFISLDPSVSTCNTLENVYLTLRNRFNGAGYAVREQNVSLGINHTGLKIDIVAGVKHHPLGLDHSIWKRKAQTWTKTNIDDHIKYVIGSGRVFDIKAIKIWRKLQKLDFPSFYLELSVIEALRGKSLLGNPSGNFVGVMEYLSDEFVDRTILDPSNQSNEISDELTQAEKGIIKNAAATTLIGNWNQALW
jgi:hypothetical protein